RLAEGRIRPGDRGFLDLRAKRARICAVESRRELRFARRALLGRAEQDRLSRAEQRLERGVEIGRGYVLEDRSLESDVLRIARVDNVLVDRADEFVGKVRRLTS